MSSDAKLLASKSVAGRLLSIDALRGFDMFWIIGGEHLANGLARLVGGPVQKHVSEQLEHVPWEGFHFYDLIFPLFLFVVGVVLPFSVGKMREKGEPAFTIYLRIIRRTLLLFALGLVYNNLLHGTDWPSWRIAGVLQRIALCYFFAAVITLNTGVRGQVAITALLLLGYWAILAFVPAPGSVAGDYSKETNLAGYIDRHYLPGKIYDEYYKYGDNEGILSTLPAIATALLGVLAGHWLRSQRSAATKVLGLMLAGLFCLIAGYVWSYWFPIIKNIWTSSFVLFAGGWSLLLLALFYGIIDGLGFRAWAFFFVVIGANAILIYILSSFFQHAVNKYVGSLEENVLLATSVLAVEWLFLLYLYHKRIFLRV
jgi:predicted acyltransferase